jgi:hypothetical protein
MSNEQAWYIGERAEALARVQLTRRKDLRVYQELNHTGVDFLVEISKDARNTRRVFGIQIKGQVEAINETTQQKTEISDTYTNQMNTDVFPFPICVFFFTMEDDRGYYTWLTEPIITQDGQPKLRVNAGEQAYPLMSLELSAIIEQVNTWYDALSKALAA